MLTDEGASTGMFAICCVVMQLTSILKTRAAYWAKLQVITTIDRKERDFGVYNYLQLSDTAKYILKNIFLCIIKELYSDQEESWWKRQKHYLNNVNDRISKINCLHIADMSVAKWAST